MYILVPVYLKSENSPYKISNLLVYVFIMQ